MARRVGPCAASAGRAGLDNGCRHWSQVGSGPAAPRDEAGVLADFWLVGGAQRAFGEPPARAKELAVQLVMALSTQKASRGHVRQTRSAEARRVEGMWPLSQEHDAEPATEWELAGHASLAAEVGGQIRNQQGRVWRDRVGGVSRKRT